MTIQEVKLLFLAHLKHYVLWLKISVDKFANAMHVVKTHKQLLCNLSHQRNRNASILILLDQVKKILAKDFKAHDEVPSIDTMMEEPIIHLEAVVVISGSSLPKIALYRFYPNWAVVILGHKSVNFLFIK